MGSVVVKVALGQVFTLSALVLPCQCCFITVSALHVPC